MLGRVGSPVSTAGLGGTTVTASVSALAVVAVAPPFSACLQPAENAAAPKRSIEPRTCVACLDLVVMSAPSGRGAVAMQKKSQKTASPVTSRSNNSTSLADVTLENWRRVTLPNFALQQRTVSPWRTLAHKSPAATAAVPRLVRPTVSRAYGRARTGSKVEGRRRAHRGEAHQARFSIASNVR